MGELATAKRKRPRAGWVAFIAGMASYIDGGAIASFSIALVLFQEPLGIDEGQLGILLSILTFGIAIGAAVGGRLGDAFGRRPVFLTTVSLVVVGLMLLMFVESFELLLLAAVMVGFGAGADLPVSIATISEAAQDKNRGFLVSLSQTLWFAAQITTSVLSLVVGGMGRLGGQILFGHIALVGIIVLVLRFTIPESEDWKTARAEQRAGAHTVRAQRVGLMAVARDRRFLVPFVALVIFYTFVSAATLTVNQYGAYIAVNIANSDVQGLATAGLIAGLPLGVICALLFMRLADTRFRMVAYLVGTAAFVVSFLIPVAFGFNFLTLVLIIGFGTIGGGLAGEAIMRVWAQENFPTLMRSSVQGAVIGVGRLLSAVAVLLTPLLLSQPKVLFLVLGLIVTVGLVVGYIAFRRPRFDAFALEAEDLDVVDSREQAGVPSSMAPAAHDDLHAPVRND